MPIPIDLQSVFGKKAFKQAMRTSDKSEAIIRSGPPIAHFKAQIETARRDPSDAFEPFLKSSQATLKAAASNPETNPDTIAAVEDVLRDRLLASQGVRDQSALPPSKAAEAFTTYEVTIGKLAPFDSPLQD